MKTSTKAALPVPLQRLVRRLRELWAEATHRHEWVMTNDASMEDVPDEYPPSRVCYVSPKRKCLKCGAGEWYVGPEVCGGNRARWVTALVDYSPPNDERIRGDAGARKQTGSLSPSDDATCSENLPE